MPWREFADWQRFAEVHPFPADLIDIHGAMQMALLRNVYRDKDAPVFRAVDFLIVRGLEPAPETKKPGRRKVSEAERMRAAFGG